jgi:hypothetical protein
MVQRPAEDHNDGDNITVLGICCGRFSLVKKRGRYCVKTRALDRTLKYNKKRGLLFTVYIVSYAQVSS